MEEGKDGNKNNRVDDLVRTNFERLCRRCPDDVEILLADLAIKELWKDVVDKLLVDERLRRVKHRRRNIVRRNALRRGLLQVRRDVNVELGARPHVLVIDRGRIRFEVGRKCCKTFLTIK